MQAVFSEVGERRGSLASSDYSSAEGIIGFAGERKAVHGWMSGDGVAGRDSSSSVESGKANWWVCGGRDWGWLQFVE